MKFSELAEGDQFNYKGILYVKTPPKKISCCKTMNAQKVGGTEKIMVKPVEEVEKVTSAQ